MFKSLLLRLKKNAITTSSLRYSCILKIKKKASYQCHSTSLRNLKLACLKVTLKEKIGSKEATDSLINMEEEEIANF